MSRVVTLAQFRRLQDVRKDATKAGLNHHDAVRAVVRSGYDQDAALQVRAAAIRARMNAHRSDGGDAA